MLLCACVGVVSAVPLASERSVARISANATRLAKRFDGARFTFYDAGLGACGEVNSNSDFVGVLITSQYRRENLTNPFLHRHLLLTLF
jgi:hypothetical protein